MTKATSSAVDFLAMVGGEPEYFEVNGVTVQLRGLTFAESQSIVRKYKDDDVELSFQFLLLGLVEPKMLEEQLRNAKPGPLMKMARRVVEISGMAEDSGPLAPGGGS